ncbi:MAG: glycosyltransferase [Fidelibacterota bacterium]
MKSKNSLKSKLNLIEEKIRNREYMASLDLLESIYIHNSADLHINLLIGEIHLAIGQMREAEKYFRNSLKIDGNHFQALYGMGKTLYLRGKIDDGLTAMEKAYSLAPGKYDICRDLAEIYSDQNNRAKAETFYLQAAEIVNYNNESLVYLLEFYSESNELDKAKTLIHRHFNKNTKNRDLLFRKGIIDIQDNEYEAAIQTFTQILNLSGNAVDALYHRGFCYLNLNEVEKAREDFQNCLKLKPDADDIHATLALTYTLEGKVSHSIDVWKEFFPILTKKASPKSRQAVIGKIQPMKIIDTFDSQENQEGNELSIVIPVYNEEESLIILFDKIKSVLQEIGKSYEIIFIDDGSTDNSLTILESLSRQNDNVVTLKFRRNYGQTAAFAAGFKYASGDIVITMDADLQNDPVDIPKLLAKMSEGYDLVSGWRKNRQDKRLTRKIPSKIANRIINKLIEGTGIRIHDFGCSLKAYKKAIVKRIKLYGEMHRFIPAYAAWLGIKVAEIPVTHHSRKFGEAKYGLERVWRVILDLITLRFYTGFRTHPLLFFGKFALITIFSGFTLSLLLFLSHLLLGIGITGQTFLIFLIFTMLGGLQFIIVGLLSEIITRGFFEAKKSDEYLVEQIIK